MNDDKPVKRSRRKNVSNRKMIAMFCIMLILSFAVGGTLAYIAVATPGVENQFEVAMVSCKVNANGKTFSVTNTGNVDAYIRADVVVNWMDENGDVIGIAPKQQSDYTMTIGEGWELAGDGFYYYDNRVAPANSDNDTTSALVTSIALNAVPPTGYELSIEVVAEAIQADGDTDDGSIPAYQDAWGISGMFTN